MLIRSCVFHYELELIYPFADGNDRMDKATIRWSKIKSYLITHPFIMNADVHVLCDISAATANRILAGLVKEGKLIKCLEGGYWVYRISF